MGTRTVDTIGLLVFTECMGVSDSLLLYAWLPGSLSLPLATCLWTKPREAAGGREWKLQGQLESNATGLGFVHAMKTRDQICSGHN